MRSITPQYDSEEELNLIDPQPVLYPYPVLPKEHSDMEDYSTLATPERCVADFCLIPIGTPSASVSNEIAAVQRLMKASGLEYSMHSAGTTVEGQWDAVMALIGKAHSLIHKNGIARVQTDIRAGSRTDKIQHFSEKVSKVESLLASDSNPSTTFPTPSSSTAASTTTTSPSPTSTSITAPPTTSSITSYSSKGPWISASMHLRRSFIPPEQTNGNSLNQNGQLATQNSSGGVRPGYHTTSIQFETGFENFRIQHLAWFVIGVVTLKALFAPMRIEVTPGGPGFRPRDLGAPKGKFWG